MDLKTLLGSAYKDNMTFAEVESALKDRKLVDLDGETKYVAFDKHQKVVDELKALKEEAKDLPTMKADYEILKAEKTARELGGKLTAWGVNDKFAEDVIYKIEKGKIAKDEDEKKFESNVKAFLKDNPQYAKSVAQVRTLTTSGGGNGANVPNGKDEHQKDINKGMNDTLRDAFLPK
jgi:hypothetical protein